MKGMVTQAVMTGVKIWTMNEEREHKEA